MSDVIHIVGVAHGQARNTKYTKDPVASQHSNTHDKRKQGTKNNAYFYDRKMKFVK